MRLFLYSFKELDMNSMFVSKAALIARRKLEQKQETKEKKKSPVKEEPKVVPDKLDKDPDDEKKVRCRSGCPCRHDATLDKTDHLMSHFPNRIPPPLGPPQLEIM